MPTLHLDHYDLRRIVALHYNVAPKQVNLIPERVCLVDEGARAVVTVPIRPEGLIAQAGVAPSGTIYNDLDPLDPGEDAKTLRDLIGAIGVSQTEVSDATGIPKSTISDILSGKRHFTRQHILALRAWRDSCQTSKSSSEPGGSSPASPTGP